MSSRAYRPSRRTDAYERTRRRIMGAVRDLLEEGKFHESTVETVAERAGVARATLYQHFRSRLGLIDAMCETFDENPALVALRKEIDLGSADEALERTIAHVCSFWASEERVLVQLYGVAAVDPAAEALVGRQRTDRRGELARVARRLAKEGRLGDGLNEKRALTLLMVLTSFETFRELRHAGVSERGLPATLQETARTLLLR